MRSDFSFKKQCGVRFCVVLPFICFVFVCLLSAV